MAGTHEVTAEIRALRDRLPHVTGVLVATVDGLLVTHEVAGVQAETLAAMSAAQLGLGQQLARAACQGGFLEAVTRTADGYLAVYAAGANALLTVVGAAELNIGRLHHETRPVAERVGELLAVAEPRR